MQENAYFKRNVKETIRSESSRFPKESEKRLILRKVCSITGLTMINAKKLIQIDGGNMKEARSNE